MKALWLLAAAITIAACASRSEDEVGVAPERADSAGAAQRVDTATYAPPNTAAGRTESVPTDSAEGQRTSPAQTNEASEMSGDSADVDKVKGDSALTGHDAPTADSTAAQPRR